MGKNQAHEQRKRAMGSGGGGGDGDAPPSSTDHSGVDVSYHTPEWHAARVAALTAERMTWDEFKKKAAEKESLAGGEEEAMRKYRALLDADRAKLLARGTKNEHLKAALELKDKKIKKKDSSKKKKDKKSKKKHKSKDKQSSKKKKKKKKRAKSEEPPSSASESSSSSSSSDSE